MTKEGVWAEGIFISMEVTLTLIQAFMCKSTHWRKIKTELNLPKSSSI